MIAREAAAARFPLLTTAGRDDKAWAKRILYREELRDRTLTAIQVKFAKMALDVKDERSSSHNN